MKTYKVDFSKGINVVMDKRLVPEGYIVLADNVDLRNGSLRPFKFPEPYVGIQGGIPTGTTCIYEFKNNWFFSSLYRDYTSEYVSAQSRIYFCETTISPSGINSQTHLPPQKVVDGVQANLGSIVPSLSPTITGTISDTPAKFMAAISITGGNLVTGSYAYRISAIINNQIMSPSQAIIANIPQNSGVNVTAGSVTLSWATVSGASGYVVFGRVLGQEQTLFSLGSGATTVIDNGSISPSGSYATNYQPTNPLTYVYTYVRDVGTMIDESGPSPISGTANSSFVRTISRNPLNDGFYSGSATYSANTVPAVALFTIVAFSKNGTNTILTTSYLTATTVPWWVSGNSLIFSNDTTNTPYKFALPLALSDPQSAPTVSINPGGVLPAGPYVYAFAALRGQTTNFVAGGSPATTLASPASSSVTVSGSQAPYLSWSGINGASGYDVYRQSGGVWYHLTPPGGVSTISGNITSFIDNGTYASTVTTLPNTNVTGVIYGPIDQSKPISWDNPYPISTGRIVVVTDAVPASLLSSIPSSPFNIFEAITYISGVPSGPVDQDAIYVNPSNGVTAGVSTIFLPTSGFAGYQWINTYIPYSTVSSLTFQDVPNNGYYTYWNIYRAGDTGSSFSFVAQVPIGTTSYVDTVSVTGLGESIPTAYNDATTGGYVSFEPPPADLLSPVPYNGMLFGIDGNVVRWTPTDYPDAWPAIYTQSFAYPPQRMLPYSGGVYVFCEDGVWRADGFLPGQVSFQKTRADGCIAPYTPRIIGSHLLYLARRGVMALSGMDSTCITERFIPYRLLTEPSAFIGANSGDNGLGNVIDGGYAVSIFLGNIDGGYSNSVFSGSIDGGDQTTGSTFWWLATDHTSSYGALLDIGMNPIPAADTFGWITAKDKPISGLIWEARSFAWQNKYYIYFVNAPTSDYQGNPCWCIDLGITNLAFTLPNYPISTLGFKPQDVHVTSTGECIALLNIDPLLDQNNQSLFYASQAQFNYTFSPIGSTNTKSLYRFNPSFGTNVPIRFRTSEVVAGAPQSRKRWREVRLNGSGSCQVRVFIDGALWTLSNGNVVSNLTLSESPIHPSRILLPTGAWGYSCSAEVCGDATVRLIEFGYDPMTGED